MVLQNKIKTYVGEGCGIISSFSLIFYPLAQFSFSAKKEFGFVLIFLLGHSFRTKWVWFNSGFRYIFIKKLALQIDFKGIVDVISWY